VHPKIGALPTYAFFYGGSALVFAAVCFVLRRRMGLGRWLWVAQTACYAFGMYLGAKVLYDLGHERFDAAALLTIAGWERSGLWGGPLVVLATAVPAALVTRQARGALDLLALSLPGALAVAHVGCFCAGCCYGAACAWPWGVTFPAGGQAPADGARHPTQLYEVAVLMATLAVLVALRRSARWEGWLLAWLLALYGAGRALVEVFRGDVRFAWGGASLSQAVCAAVAVVAVGALAVRRVLVRRAA
jgi:phosphatidylglycerol---prolipoprotein diacylglyceryl transferase